MSRLFDLSLFSQYASEEAELLLVGNKLDCETDRIISRQQGERVCSRHTHPHVYFLSVWTVMHLSKPSKTVSNVSNCVSNHLNARIMFCFL